MSLREWTFVLWKYVIIYNIFLIQDGCEAIGEVRGHKGHHRPKFIKHTQVFDKHTFETEYPGVEHKRDVAHHHPHSKVLVQNIDQHAYEHGGDSHDDSDYAHHIFPGISVSSHDYEDFHPLIKGGKPDIKYEPALDLDKLFQGKKGGVLPMMHLRGQHKPKHVGGKSVDDQPWEPPSRMAGRRPFFRRRNMLPRRPFLRGRPGLRMRNLMGRRGAYMRRNRGLVGNGLPRRMGATTVQRQTQPLPQYQSQRQQYQQQQPIPLRQNQQQNQQSLQIQQQQYQQQQPMQQQQNQQQNQQPLQIQQQQYQQLVQQNQQLVRENQQLVQQQQQFQQQQQAQGVQQQQQYQQQTQQPLQQHQQQPPQQPSPAPLPVDDAAILFHLENLQPISGGNGRKGINPNAQTDLAELMNMISAVEQESLPVL